ncbi:MAG: sigma-54 interaction domain-containing protein [Deltaproteobacteria bacterium]
MKGPERTISICTADASLERWALDSLRHAPSWKLSCHRWTDGGAAGASAAPHPSVYLVVLAEQTDGTAAAGLFGALGPGSGRPPVLVVGAPPPEGERIDCWLPGLPAPTILEGVLAQLAGAEPRPKAAAKPPPDPTVAWRRKSDMIVGSSTATQLLLGLLERLAPSSAAVLLTGESGTGKELVARALHYAGPRAKMPFLAINCAAIPETLFEAELFGYARGAFTGAVTARTGVFEAADGGTVFLDEIGEMPLQMQAKLLRVLETGQIVRLGSNDIREVDARLVAATNRDLEAEVRRGRFREDLYYRIRVFPVHLPPLRERPEDIPALVVHHLGLIAEAEHRTPPALTPAALEKLLGHGWPGNVRELVNVLQRATLLAERGSIDAAQLPLSGAAAAPLIRPYHEAKSSFEAGYWQTVLGASKGNISLAARLAGKTRKEIYEALKRLSIDAAGFRADAPDGGEEP